MTGIWPFVLRPKRDVNNHQVVWFQGPPLDDNQIVLAYVCLTSGLPMNHNVFIRNFECQGECPRVPTLWAVHSLACCTAWPAAASEAAVTQPTGTLFLLLQKSGNKRRPTKPGFRGEQTNAHQQRPGSRGIFLSEFLFPPFKTVGTLNDTTAGI